MAKGRKARSRPNRRMRRPRRGRGRKSTNRIPLQPFNRSLMNTVIRGSAIKTFTDNALSVYDFTTSTLLGSYNDLFSIFREVKIMKVHIWVQTFASTASAGVFTIVVAPKDEINSVSTYDQVSSTPGSISGKSFTTLHGIYFPTEPSERDWFSENRKKQLFSIQFMSYGIKKTDASGELKFQIVWDLHLKARGLTVKTAGIPTLRSDEYDMLSDVAGNMKMQP